LPIGSRRKANEAETGWSQPAHKLQTRPPGKGPAPRISMSHLVPLLEFNLSASALAFPGKNDPSAAFSKTLCRSKTSGFYPFGKWDFNPLQVLRPIPLPTSCWRRSLKRGRSPISHSQITMTLQPASRSSASVLQSRAMFSRNFCCQKPIRLLGVYANLQPGWRCQKHP
jgi:hypothetical protein